MSTIHANHGEGSCSGQRDFEPLKLVARRAFFFLPIIEIEGAGWERLHGSQQPIQEAVKASSVSLRFFLFSSSFWV